MIRHFGGGIAAVWHSMNMTLRQIHGEGSEVALSQSLQNGEIDKM
jgi:hypothetical protein